MKKLCLLIACFSALFAQDNKVVEWGEEAFFKKTWADATIFCTSHNERMPSGEEQQTLSYPQSAIWANFGSSPTFEDTKGNVRCVKDNNITNLKQKQLLDLQNIIDGCNTVKQRSKAVSDIEEPQDSNKTFTEKAKETFKGIGTGVVKVGSVATGAAIAIGTGGAGAGMGGSIIDGALGIKNNGSGSLDALNDRNCKEADELFTKLSRISK